MAERTSWQIHSWPAVCFVPTEDRNLEAGNV